MVEVDIQKEFRDIHKDKLGFLIGSGVSLRDLNESLLTSYITVAVSQAIFKVQNPTYFFSTDGYSGIHGLLETAYNSPTTKLILLQELWCSEYDDRSYTFLRKENHVMKKEDDKLIMGRLSSHVGLHFMYILGCSPIILLGMDGHHEDGYRGFWMLPEYYNKVHPKMREFYGPDPKTSFNTLHPDGENILTVDGHKLWGDMIKDPHTIVLNATPGSSITAFPKMKLTEVLEKYGDRKNGG